MPKQDTHPNGYPDLYAKAKHHALAQHNVYTGTDIDYIPYWHRDSLGDWHTHPLGTEPHDHFHPATNRAGDPARHRERWVRATDLQVVVPLAVYGLFCVALGALLAVVYYGLRR